MTRRTKILLGCLALLALFMLGCVDLDIDRTDWNHVVGEGTPQVENHSNPAHDNLGDVTITPTPSG